MISLFKSLSARRAWIEIKHSGKLSRGNIVALRKESVDRNRIGKAAFGAVCVALRKESVDRNCRYPARCVGLLVALRKESVDRNEYNTLVLFLSDRRSPQGERG